MELNITKLPLAQNAPFELLLLADETVEAIKKYLYVSDVYTVHQAGNTIAVFVLYPLNAAETELKNIAVSTNLQGAGIGSTLITYIKNICRIGGYSTLLVGTPDSAAQQISFYKKEWVRARWRQEKFLYRQLRGGYI